MTGSQIIALTNSILGNEELDETFALQMINVIKNTIQLRRPWQVLKKKNTSVTVNGSNAWDTPHAMPSDFLRWIKDGELQLFDGTNYPQIATEVPFEDSLEYKNESFRFYCDYGALEFYITGIVPGSYTVYQWYIYNPGEITADTEWLRFPAIYHPILAYELAVMWRLGTDWDDVNARNADDNARRADMLYKAMELWDTNMALSQIRNIEYPQNKQGKNVGNTRNWGPRGTYRT